MKNSFLLFATLFTASALANVVVPTWDETSQQYTFGAVNFTPSNGASYPYLSSDVNQFAYPDWSSLPQAAAMSCTGAAMLYSAPDGGRTVDWTSHGHLLFTGNNIVADDTKLTFVADQWFYLYYQTSAPTVSGGIVSANLAKNNGGIVNFELNLEGGGWYIANGRLNKVSGGLTGASTAAKVLLGSASGSALSVVGRLDYAGSIFCSGGQYGEYIDLSPSEMTDRQIYCIYVGCAAHASNIPQYLVFNPSAAGSTLRLRTLRAAASSASVSTTATYYRQGGHVLLYNGNTIETEYLNSGLHFYASDKMLKTKAAKPTVGLGVGNVIVTTECKAEAGDSMYLGTNINFKAAKVTNAINFDFTAQEDGVNGRTLEITGSCNAGCTAKATSPSMLPRVLKGFAGTVDLTVTDAKSDWTFPFDFAADEPCPAACAGSGTLAVPASGTIAVTIANGDKATRGTYPLMTATSGGAALTAAAWPATINGETLETLTLDEVTYTIIRGDTGISLRVEPIEGLGIAVE